MKLFKKKKVIVFLLLTLILAGYFSYKSFFTNKESETTYTTTTVEKGTIVVSVSGSGQVTVLEQVDIKPKVAGEIIWVGIENGQEVKSGQVILSIDDTDIKEEIEDAEWELEEEKDNYDETIIDAERTLAAAYEDGYSTVSTVFFKLSDYVEDLKDVLGTEESTREYIGGYKAILGSNSQLIQNLLDDYDVAFGFYNENFVFFRKVYKESDRETIYQLINDTIETTKAVAEALESARHMYDAIVVESYQGFNVASQINTMQPKIESDVSSVYSNISSLEKIKETIDDSNKNTPKNIATALKDLQKKEKALEDLKEELDNYTVKAPFSGVITEVKVKKGDSVSSGTAVVTLATKQKMGEITLNEIDVAQVETGQKTTITFDAIDDLTLTGEVVEVDTLGTVSQGVVTYDAKIAFDAQDEKVKPGMSISVAIITNVKQNIIMVPNAAIKYQGDTRYVEVMSDDNTITYQQVEIGISNDTYTEIVSGLEEGGKVVSSQTTGSSNSSNSSRNENSSPGNGMEMMRMF